ncbi:MAG: hypothetical protein IKX14_02700 [Neisseriaceae bacterium]|nr:hypothetical protein [Neisseriaceae bacterium]
MQKLSQFFIDNFDTISQKLNGDFYKNKSYSDLFGNHYSLADFVVVSNRKKKKFIRECVNDLQKCQSIQDFIAMKYQHYRNASGYSLFKQEKLFVNAEHWQEKLRHLQKYMYFSIFHCCFIDDNSVQAA